MKPRIPILAAILLGCLCQSAQAQPASLKDTGAFIESKPELKKWFEQTSATLQKELTKLAKTVDEIEDPEAFGLAKDSKDLANRKAEAKKEVLRCADLSERMLLAMLTATDLKNRPYLQKRVLATPTFTIALDLKHDKDREGYMREKDIVQNGDVRTVREVTVALFPNTLRPKVLLRNLTHELLHVFVHGKHVNRLNKDRVLPVLPVNVRIDLAALRHPLPRYKPYLDVYRESLAEGVTELHGQKAAELLGESVDAVRYQVQIGCVLLLQGCDAEMTMEWYSGSISNAAFHDRIRKGLGKLLTDTKKFTAEEADRVGFALGNLLLDEVDHRGRGSSAVGANADFSIIMHSGLRSLYEAEIDVEKHFKKTAMPLSVEQVFFPKK